MHFPDPLNVERIVAIVALAVMLTCVIIWLTCNTKAEEEPVSLFSDFKVDATAAEGRVNKVYADTLGNLTAGIGHKINTNVQDHYKLGDTVSNDQIDVWFDLDYAKTLESARKHFEEFDEWPRLVQLAVLNWIFQLGPGAPEEFPHATRALQGRRWKEAADEWEFANPRTRRHSKWFAQTTHRCLQEVKRLRYVADFVDKGN